MKRFVIIFICLFSFVLNSQIGLSAQSKTNNIQAVKLQLKWKHQFEFAGYYAAIEKGYYEEAGIHVDLLIPGENTNPIDVVNNGHADFGIAGSGILLERAKNKEVVVLASIFQHSPFALIVPQNSGITTLRQLKNKKIAMEADSTEIIAALNSSMVFPKPEHIVPLKYNAQQLFNGEADAITSYITDEPFLLDSLGFKYNILTFRQNGIDFYGDVLFTTEKLIETNPELVENFRNASLKGWEYAMGHPYEIIFLIFNKYSEEHSTRHLMFEMTKMKELISEDFVEIGYSNPARWKKILDEYQRLGLIDQEFTIDGLLYQPNQNSFSNFPWKVFFSMLLVVGLISFLAYVFYRNSKLLKHEIEARIKTQAELTESEALYRSILNASPDTIIITDLSGNIQFISPQATKMFGYKLNDLLNQPLLSYIHPNDLIKAQEAIQQMFANTFTGATEYRGIKADGSIFLIEVNGEFIRNLDGLPQKMIFVSRDISERKAIEAKVRKSEERFRQIVEQSQSVIWEVNADGLYTYVSPIAKSVWGYAPEELVGKKYFYDLHPANGREKFKELAFQVFESKQSFRELENQVVAADGKILWVVTNGIPILDDQNNLQGYRGSDNDITSLKKNEEAFKELNASLEAKIQERTELLSLSNDTLREEIEERKVIEKEMQNARKEAEQANMAKSEFLSRMSHELRTPMNSILGFAQLLEMGELNKSQQKGVQHILKSGKHLLNLINEVLDITRIEAGRLSLSIEPVQLAPIISETIDSIKPQTLDKQISIQFKPSPTNRLFVLADKQRLQQILINLLGNAIKYNNEGGSVLVESEVLEVAESTPGKVRISVTDTGIGIPAESIPKLFKPFERIGAEQSAEEGSGLGLTVVKKLTEAMNGTIEVESTPEKGSKFWIDLPQAESQLKSVEKLEDTGIYGQENKKGTILYIEDNQPNIELIEQILLYQRPNIRLITNTTGRETIQLANENSPDLIILDLNLPDIHGSEVMKNLKNDISTRLIPVVVVSADAMPNQLEKLKKLGAVDYLTKPINVQVFLTVVDHFIPG